MRWSQLHVPTLREDPAEAEAASHRLLVRAGFIRQLAPGQWSLLPLAVRVRAKVMDVIREELGRVGGQEVLLPAMLPAEPWRRSGRPAPAGEEVLTPRDRGGAELALGAANEAAVATLAAELRSYRDLPQRWFQFQATFRDEPRARGGPLRARELTMLDAWSLDLDAEGLDRAVGEHRRAFARVFERLGIPVVAAAAPGGGGATAFVSPSAAGDDLVLRCSNCDAAATAEAATAAVAPAADGPGPAAPERFPTPGARTIEDLARDFGAPAERQIKTLVYVVDGRLTLVLLRGDHSLAERRLALATAATALRPADPDEIRDALGASPGSLGAVGVRGLPVVADAALRGRRDLFTGANVDDVHLRGVDMDRDVPVGTWADLREVAAGEPCPRCGEPLEALRGIEVGRVVPRGDAAGEALDVSVLGPDGARARPLLGGYGIGVERAVAAAVEANHDEHGIVWPRAIAPFAVAVVALDAADADVAKAADALRGRLGAAGVDVVVDDRDLRPGIKFRDSELVGIPYRVTIGPRDLANGTVELTERATGARRPLPVDTAADHVLALLTGSDEPGADAGSRQP